MSAESPPPYGSIIWSDEFELGIAEIDTQHRRLLDLVNAFAHAVAQGSGDTVAVSELLRAAVAHFAYEDDLMHRVGYERAALHAEQHAELLASMERLQQRLGSQFRQTDRRKTLNFLSDWFTIHIVRTDADLARHLKALGTA